MKISVISICLLFGVACLPAIGATKEMKILMIGNSYTARTWKEFEGFLKADRGIRPSIKKFMPGGKQLCQHIKNPKILEAIRGKTKWDVVMLQDQSQLPAFAMIGSQKMLENLDAGGPELIKLILKHQPQAKIVLFETWARHRDPDRQKTLKYFQGKPELMQAALCKGYRRIMKKEGANGWDFSEHVAIAPVGRAWAAWYAEHGYDQKELKLHGPDNSHPGKLGAFLTAAVQYEVVTGKAAASVKYDAGIKTKVAGKSVAKLLEDVADKAVADERKLARIAE